MNPRTRNLKLPLIALAALASLAAAAFGIQPPQDAAGLEFSSDGLKVETSLVVIEPCSEKAFANSELQAFFAERNR